VSLGGFCFARRGHLGKPRVAAKAWPSVKGAALTPCRTNSCGTTAPCDKATACQPRYRKSRSQRPRGPRRRLGHSADDAPGPFQRKRQSQETLLL
jgi:hypothetical protein